MKKLASWRRRYIADGRGAGRDLKNRKVYATRRYSSVVDATGVTRAHGRVDSRKTGQWRRDAWCPARGAARLDVNARWARHVGRPELAARAGSDWTAWRCAPLLHSRLLLLWRYLRGWGRCLCRRDAVPLVFYNFTTPSFQNR
jgi:hypothetical protein